MMFSSFMEQKCYIQEVIDPATGKHYNLHIYSRIPETGFFAGFIMNEFYLTDKDPKHGVIVNIGRKGFAKDEFETTDDMTAELENIIRDCLPEGFKRFEAIMASGIKGNELKF